MLKAVFFDLDGTIGNTLPLCVIALQQSMEPFLGRVLSENEILSKLFGPSEEGIIEKLIPAQYDEGIINYLKFYEKLHDQCCPCPYNEIIDLLRLLKSKGIILGLVTGKGPKTAKITLSKFKIESVFDAIETGSPNGSRKTEGIRALLKKFNISPHEAVYVGDAVQDITAAREASVRIISAAWADLTDKQELFKQNPDNTFSDIKQFRAYLETLMTT
jgi:HAD superfamily hydrolase (TIGR01549 family)